MSIDLDNKAESIKQGTKTIYRLADAIVQRIKTIVQFLIGVYVFFFVAAKAWVHFGGTTWDIYVVTEHIMKERALFLLSQALMVSAAIELAYMLFNEGSDEAIDPFILGITAAGLYALSESKSMLAGSIYFEDAILVFLFSLSLLVLFYLKFKCHQQVHSLDLNVSPLANERRL